MATQSFVKGTLILSIATLVSKILGSFFRIPLQNIAGDEVLGIFSLVYPIYMVALILSVAGIPVAISKLISEAKAGGKEEKVQQIFRTASLLAILFGLLSFTIIFSASEWIASILGSQETQLSIKIVAVTLLIAPYMAVYRGFFQGHQNMTPTGTSQVIEQFIRVILILVIAYFLVVKGATNDVIGGGVMIGSSIGAIASLIYLRLTYHRFKKINTQASVKFDWGTFKHTSKTILKISLPISVGAITMALMNVVDSLTVPYSLLQAGEQQSEVTYLYGIYGRGLALVQIATVFSSSVVLSLIPLISKLLQEKKNKEAQETVEKTFHLTHLLSWPIAIGLLILTVPVNLALFTDVAGSDVLAAINFSSVFTSLAILGTGILQGLNKANQAALIIVGAVVVKAVLNFVLIDSFGIVGAGYATILIYVLIILVNLIVLRKVVAFRFLNKRLINIVIGSLIMGGIIAVPNLLFDFASWPRMLALIYVMIAAGGGALIYTVYLFITKEFSLEDLQKLPKVGKFFHRKKENGTKEMGRPTVRKKPLWIALILLFALTLPGIFQRFYSEWTNNQYEIVVPYEDIVELSEGTEELPKDTIFEQLRSVGLDAVSIEPETLETLVEKGEISLLTTEKVNDLALLSEEFAKLDSVVTNEQGAFVHIHEDNNVTDQLSEIYANNIKVTANGKEFFFIPDTDKEKLEAPIGFSGEAVASITDEGLKVIPRIPNYNIEDNEALYNQLFEIGKGSSILFLGKEVLGVGNPEATKDLIENLNQHEISLYEIEFNEIKGLATLANGIDMNITRLHSMNLDEVPSMSEAEDRAIRAVKERNIRSLFVRVKDGEAKDSFEGIKSLIYEVQTDMPHTFADGEPEAFKDVQTIWWIPAGLAAVVFVALTVLQILNHRALALLAGAGSLLLVLGYAVLGKLLFIQALALGVAILTPVLAVYPLEKVTTLKGIVAKYLKATAISVIGIAIVVGLLNGNEFFVKMQEFRGVKLVYVFPIAFAFIYAVFGDIRKLLATSVRYWHLGVIGIIGIVGLYYIIRTGNEGSVSTIELLFRQKLEELLYVRPRTKEFLIGFPVFVLALYISKQSLKAAKYLMIPGIIGFLSIVNTFTHLHIPLHVSVLRTIYSLVLGFIIGLLFIQLYKIGTKLYEQYVKTRWSA